MKMQDSREIRAERSAVFNAILDPNKLRECIAGAECVSGNIDEGFEAIVTQKVGPVKATFKGQVTIADIVRPETLTISGAGKGGAAGFATGRAHVTLAELGNGVTKLTYDIEVKVGGKLAQIGSRIIAGFAKKMADNFFAQLQSSLESTSEEAVEEISSHEPAAAKDDQTKWYKRIIRKV